MERTAEQLKQHYEVEKELAAKLKQSSREQRKTMYTAVYDEMLTRVPTHPLLTRKTSAEDTAKAVRAQLSFLERFVEKDSVFAEIGPGDCAVTFEMCKKARKAYAIDVSNEIVRQKVHPENFELIISDGTSIPLPAESVDVVYSNQLMEHIHPDDAIEQLNNVKNVLVKGGKYICITPSRINGPHDVSRFFDKRATGFHLKEYTFTELKKVFRSAGFAKVQGYIGAKGTFLRLPFGMISFLEKSIGLLPKGLRRSRLFDPVLNIRVVGIK